MDVCLLPIQRGGSVIDRAVYGALLKLHERVCPPHNAGHHIIKSLAFKTVTEMFFLEVFFPSRPPFSPLFPSRLEVASPIPLRDLQSALKELLYDFSW